MAGPKLDEFALKVFLLPPLKIHVFEDFGDLSGGEAAGGCAETGNPPAHNPIENLAENGVGLMDDDGHLPVGQSFLAGVASALLWPDAVTEGHEPDLDLGTLFPFEVNLLE